MDSSSSYKGEDKKIYRISVSKDIKKKELKLFIYNEEATDRVFSSEYKLDYLNVKFNNELNFKDIENFEQIIYDNIRKKTLVLKSPYKNVISSIWKLYPKDKDKLITFSLISTLSLEIKISLLFYSDYLSSEKIVKEMEMQSRSKIKRSEFTTIDLSEKVGKTLELKYITNIYEKNKFIENMVFLSEKYEKEKEEIKKEDFITIYEDRKKKGKINSNNIRTILVLFDMKHLVENITEIIEKYYEDQLFILIFTHENENSLKSKIKNSIEENLADDILTYFDLDNIFICKDNEQEYKKALLPVLKVYRYFNQLGDAFFKDLYEYVTIEGLKEEIQYLFYTHYFNILLCGRTGTGKSTFINKIMGEKKSFTLPNESAGTYRSNYYIHRKYPIKIIDVCGFAEGREGEENKQKISAIFKKDTKNIIIDEPSNDTFSFYSDKRNNIHLLLYFTVYNDKYDVFPGEMPIMEEALLCKIPIIFIVNKCPEEVFKKEKKMKFLVKAVKSIRDKSKFKDSKTYFIDCITKNGFDKLLLGIFDAFKNNIISKNDLEKIKNDSDDVEKQILEICQKSIFLRDIQPQDVLLNESLINSAKDINILLVKLAGFYSNELGFWKSLDFYFFDKLYNNILRDSNKNFFPLLTDLVMKINHNFGYNNVTKKDCNDFIKLKLSQYFNIDLNNNQSKNEMKSNEKINTENNK